MTHDDLRGRGTGTDGIDLAAGYIAGRFAAAGISPGGLGGSYFQEFGFPARLSPEPGVRTIARNVVGVLPGRGVNAKEYVVIGAHYDHLGERNGEIYNGADDNASGTAALIELGYAFAATANRDRSLVLVAFSAEEIGLLGSSYFVEQPTIPSSSIVAMLNLDMIGRLNLDDERNHLAIHGLGTGATFRSIVERRTGELGLPWIPEASALGPSDHMSFYIAGYPAMFFFTGLHADYHRPGDDIEKLNFDGAVMVTELVYRIALDLVNDSAVPVFARVPEPARMVQGADAGLIQRAVLGVALNVHDSGDQLGVLIDQVAPESGAAKADLRPGDRIIKLDGQSLTGPQALRTALDSKQAGDSVELLIERNERLMAVVVILEAPASVQWSSMKRGSP